MADGLGCASAWVLSFAAPLGSRFLLKRLMCTLHSRGPLGARLQAQARCIIVRISLSLDFSLLSFSDPFSSPRPCPQNRLRGSTPITASIHTMLDPLHPLAPAQALISSIFPVSPDLEGENSPYNSPQTHHKHEKHPFTDGFIIFFCYFIYVQCPYRTNTLGPPLPCFAHPGVFSALVPPSSKPF
jgi:hypothetical protein